MHTRIGRRQFVRFHKRLYLSYGFLFQCVYSYVYFFVLENLHLIHV